MKTSSMEVQNISTKSNNYKYYQTEDVCPTYVTSFSKISYSEVDLGNEYEHINNIEIIVKSELYYD